MKGGYQEVISVKNLHKHFGSLVVLDGIDIDIKKGEKVAVIGPSGSGKSTFLRCLNLLEKPTIGHLYLKERRSLFILDFLKLQRNITILKSKTLTKKLAK